MGYQTTTGSFMSIGPAPATEDEAGFEAVSVVKINGVTDPGVMGYTFNIASATIIDSGVTLEKKTSYTRSQIDVSLVLDGSDAGQIALLAASKTNDVYTIKLTRQNGDAAYYTAQVADMTDASTVDDFETGTAKLIPQSDVLKVAA
jgi:hypothetical protein